MELSFNLGEASKGVVKSNRETFLKYLNYMQDTANFTDSIVITGKKVAVLFSGGFDSTALIIKNLREGTEVFPVVLNFNDTDEIFQTAIYKQLKVAYGDLIHTPLVIQDVYSGMGSLETYGVSQQPMCAFFAAFIPKDVMEQISEIQIGYVVGDIACSFFEELQTLYKTCLVFKHYDSAQELPKLTFPLSKTFHFETKETVQSWGADHNTFLPCISCEAPNIRYFTKTTKNYIYYIANIQVCNECASCEKDNLDHNYHQPIEFEIVLKTHR